MHSINPSGVDFTAVNAGIEYIHNGKASLSSAFEINECGAVRISLPRALGVASASIEIFNEAGDVLVYRGSLEWCDLSLGNDCFEHTIDFNELGAGLFFSRISVTQKDRVLYLEKQGRRTCLTDKPTSPCLQLSVSDFIYREPQNKLGGIIYHVFVDRFRRGGATVVKEGALLVDGWERSVPEYPAYPGAPLKNNTFYGGTLYGIIEKLDYIASLGVDTIYLSPVFDAASNHKYDTGDYMTVDSMFGGDEALSSLISAARERGIGVILDGVFNHTGSDSIYFNREGNYPSVGAYQSPSSKYYEWYDFKNYPDEYVCWWGIDILPRIHPDRPACREYFLGKDGVISKYAAMGIDGFRLDVVDELSDYFVEGIKEVLNSHNSHSVLYGEVWEDASNKIAYGVRKRYYLGRELDGVMNYPIRRGIIEYLTRRATGEIEYALGDIINNAPERIRNMQMNLLGTHDTERILTVLGGEPSEGRSNEYLSTKRMSALERGRAKRRLKMAYVILATVPGIPAIFYGDEAGLEGYHDPFNRMPYPWGHEDHGLISFYRRVGEVRRTNDVYRDGDFRLISLSPEHLVFSRSRDGISYVTVVNNTESELNLAAEGEAVAVFGAEKGRNGMRQEAFSAAIYKMPNDTEFYLYNG